MRAKPPLSELERQRLYDLTVATLSVGPLSAPRAGEREPEFTGRCIGPAVQSFIGRLRISGLTCDYDGWNAPRASICGGLSFSPDVTVHYHGQRLIAVEVKYVRGANPQDAFAKALGQCVIYSSAGYAHAVAVLVVEAAVSFRAQDAVGLRDIYAKSGVRMIARAARGDSLGPSVFSEFEVPK